MTHLAGYSLLKFENQWPVL